MDDFVERIELHGVWRANEQGPDQMSDASNGPIASIFCDLNRLLDDFCVQCIALYQLCTAILYRLTSPCVTGQKGHCVAFVEK